MSSKVRRKVPLLIIVLVTCAVFAVGAVLINIFVSQIVSNVHRVDVDYRGADGLLMTCANWGEYALETPATSLRAIMHGPDYLETYAVKAAVLVVKSYDLPGGESLTLSVDVFETGTSNPYTGAWTCTPTFAEFTKNNGDGIIVLGAVTQPVAGVGPWIIPNAQIDDMLYNPGFGTTNGGGSDPNALVMSFEFGETDLNIIYGEGWVDQADFSTLFDLRVSLSVEGT